MAQRRRSGEPFKFRSGFTIGGIAAETDRLLEAAFIQTAAFNVMHDVSDPRVGLIGRSGSGKTAILERLKKTQEHVIAIDPESLAFRFLGDSELVQALRASHVELDYFYKLLWRHVFVVEILKHLYPEESRGGLRNVFSKIKRTVRPDRDRDRALQYLDEWGGSILQAPLERVQQIHHELERRLQAELGVNGDWLKIFGLKADVAGEVVNVTSIDERVRIAKQIVNKIQVDDLNLVKNSLNAEILSDRQKPCYVLIDDLDRFWVRGELMYELVRALVLEIYEWQSVQNVKFVYALRDNILKRIESEFKSRAYQREKLRDQRFSIRWTRQELVELLDSRIVIAANDMRLGTFPRLGDLLPRQTSRLPNGVAYIIARTFLRPRDAIDFVNRIGALAVGKTRASWEHVRRAEEGYSQGRYEALLDEWHENYSGLDLAVRKLLRGQRARFKLESWNEESLLEVFTDSEMPGEGWLRSLDELFTALYQNDPGMAIESIRKQFAKVFYEIGLVGIRQAPGANLQYAYLDEPLLEDEKLDDSSEIVVHPAFQRCLVLTPDADMEQEALDSVI